jgi:hypothetical protein
VTYYVAVYKNDYQETIATGLTEDAARTLVDQIEKVLLHVCIDLMFGENKVIVGYWDE